MTLRAVVASQSAQIHFGDVPAAEVGGVHLVALEGDVGGVGDGGRGAVLDQDLQRAARLEPIDAARLVAGDVERPVGRKGEAVGHVVDVADDAAGET